MKAHIDHHSSIKQLVEGFLTAVGTMRDERMAKMTKRLTKVSILPHAFEVLLDYEEVVTPYAVDYISSQLEYSLKVKVLDSISVESSSGILGVSENNCDCNSFQSMGLPCRHILAICKFNNRSQFLPDIIYQTWSLEYYQSGFKTPVTPRRPTIVNIRPTPKRNLTQWQVQQGKDIISADGKLFSKVGVI